MLLVACDLPFPEPLNALRPLPDLFAVALLLVPAGQTALAQMALEFAGDEAATRCADAGMEQLRRAIPAARALPLLQALARGAAARLVLEDQPGQSLQLQLDVSP